MESGSVSELRKELEMQPDHENVDPEYAAYLEGECACVDGKAFEVCPYPPGKYRAEWERGWKVQNKKVWHEHLKSRLP